MSIEHWNKNKTHMNIGMFIKWTDKFAVIAEIWKEISYDMTIFHYIPLSLSLFFFLSSVMFCALFLLVVSI